MITITPQNFHADFLSKTGLGILMFGADWCIPSRKLLDMLDEVVEVQPDLIIGTVNIETQPGMVQQWLMKTAKSAASPTMIFFRKGEPVGSKLGVGTFEELTDWIQEMRNKKVTA